MSSPETPQDLHALINQLRASLEANEKLVLALKTDLDNGALRLDTWKTALETHTINMDTTIAVLNPLLGFAQNGNHQQAQHDIRCLHHSAQNARDEGQRDIAKTWEGGAMPQTPQKRRVKMPKSILKKMTPKSKKSKVDEKKDEHEEHFFDAQERSSPAPSNPKRRPSIDDRVTPAKRLKFVADASVEKRRRDSLEAESENKRRKEGLPQYERRYLSDDEWKEGKYGQVGAEV